jgi:hypothetical protein
MKNWGLRKNSPPPHSPLPLISRGDTEFPIPHSPNAKMSPTVKFD